MDKKFSKWIRTLLEEKNIDMEDTLDIENENGFNILPVGVVVEFLENQDQTTQQQVKNKLVEIDFKNGDILHFINFIGQSMLKSI